MLETYRPGTIEPDPEHEVLEKLQLGRALSRVRSLTSSQEWKVLFRSADGDDYEAIANTEKMKISTLKSKVCRWRIRLARLVG